MTLFCLVLAVFSIWDYPDRFPVHERLRHDFVLAVKKGDTAIMEKTSRLGVKLLPDDPTWHFNLACSLAYFPTRADEAFDELELAIDLGFRDRATIEKDTDLIRLKSHPRYQETLAYADYKKSMPLFTGPLSAVDATGVFGKPVSLGEQNLGWDFDVGCFVAKLKLAPGSSEPSVGDLYMNRDNFHSTLGRLEFPGLTRVTLDSAGTNRQMHLDLPIIHFPYPVFGNCSRALLSDPRHPNPYWRSMPRALLTIRKDCLNRMVKFYLSNQTWVFPSVFDTAPVGTNGDLFASLTPYCITTAGRSWSDLPYLRAALEASRSFAPDVKREIVSRGLLAPTIQTLIRKSLKGVETEDGYLSPTAHPTAFPINGCQTNRLAAAARAMTVAAIPPLAPISVTCEAFQPAPAKPELSYASAFAWSYVVRAHGAVRVFTVTARGADEFAFVQTHGHDGDVKIERLAPDTAKVTVVCDRLSPTNRVDIMVCGRNADTGWGAPSYLSVTRTDFAAPYCDPALK